jgi:hypothetical protein
VAWLVVELDFRWLVMLAACGDPGLKSDESTKYLLVNIVSIVT